VAHLHLVVPYSTPRERARARAYVEALKEIAPREWFGFADLKSKGGPGRSPAAAAGYVAKYVAKATGEGLAVKRPMYVGAFLTTRSRMTMRMARLKRYAFIRLERIGLDPDDLGAWTPDVWETVALGAHRTRGP